MKFSTLNLIQSLKYRYYKAGQITFQLPGIFPVCYIDQKGGFTIMHLGKRDNRTRLAILEGKYGCQLCLNLTPKAYSPCSESEMKRAISLLLNLVRKALEENSPGELQVLPSEYFSPDHCLYPMTGTFQEITNQLKPLTRNPHLCLCAAT